MKRTPLALALLLAASPLLANSPTAEPNAPAASSATSLTEEQAEALAADARLFNEFAEDKQRQEDPWIMASSVFLDGHPDLKNRRWAMDAYREGRFVDAFNFFRAASRFADKPSQAMVAQMLWDGTGGTAINRPLAYAWMEIAAERNYPAFALYREFYWQQMTREERRQAIALNEPLWKEYGDDVAQPRLEARMRTAKRNVTGSHAGFVGTLAIEVSTPMGSRRIDASQIYVDRFWNPEEYWRWQDEDWKELGRGQVDVGPVAQADPPASSGTGSR